jgi:RsiW-degrading membrane proteinase PrsW (M82 family)
MNYFSLLLAPLIAILFYLYLRYKFPKGEHRVLLYSYLLGFAAVILVLLAQYIATLLDFETTRSLKRATFFAFVVVGGVQEFVKFLIFRFYAVPKKIFRSPSDGIVYSVMTSLGLATSWLLWWNFFGNPVYFDGPWEMLLYVPASVIFGTIMGFFVGLGKLRNNRFIDSMTGLVAAAFFHGLFRFTFITDEMVLSVLAALGSALLAVLLVFKAVKIGMQGNKL